MENFTIHLDYRKKVPFAEQIQEQLRLLIKNGKLRPNDQLPAVRQLAFQLKINFNTVARAYRALDIEGWITTQQGRGTYVLEQMPARIGEDHKVIKTESRTQEGQENAAGSHEEIRQITTILVPPLTDALPEPGLSSEVSKTAKEIPVENADRISADPTHWIERWLAEAEHSGISLEQLHQAVLAQIKRQTDEIPSAHKLRPAQRVKKSSRKPLFQPVDGVNLWEFPVNQRQARKAKKRKTESN